MPKIFFLSSLVQNKLKLYVFKMDFITNQLKLTVPIKCWFWSWKGSNIWTLFYNVKKTQLWNLYHCWANQEKPPKTVCLGKNIIFEIFLDFFSNGTLQRVEVFFVVISASWHFIWAIKHPRTMILIFRVLMFFLQFFRPLVPGVKCKI